MLVISVGEVIRYAALVWCTVLTERDIRTVRFVPGYEGQKADSAPPQKINEAVWQALQK